ncbi:hypothetical protein [Enhygromyxa salina]|uniref:Uncharacterized protein n=1 Tax=Enhygromyxa salina TaxID=215803 RepID=A0A2S9YAB6_9BACT|nr:hypothetical protein [Enhygromyxa salina]PRQ02058.1 hypothetical protein ENSA7_56310 [Enhygromyxa salina]
MIEINNYVTRYTYINPLGLPRAVLYTRNKIEPPKLLRVLSQFLGLDGPINLEVHCDDWTAGRQLIYDSSVRTILGHMRDKGWTLEVFQHFLDKCENNAPLFSHRSTFAAHDQVEWEN